MDKQSNLYIEFNSIIESLFYQILLSKEFGIAGLGNKMILSKNLVLVFPPVSCNGWTGAHQNLNPAEVILSMEKCEDCKKLREENPILCPGVKGQKNNTEIDKVISFFQLIKSMK